MTQFNAFGGLDMKNSTWRSRVAWFRRGAACCARSSNSRTHTDPPRRAFRSAGVPPACPELGRRALLTFSSTGQTFGLTQRASTAGFAVPGSRRGTACSTRSNNSRSHTDPPRPAFRSAGVPPALLTFSSAGQTVGPAQRVSTAGFAVAGSRRGTACCARSSNSRTHTDPPGPAFRSAGVPPALLTFPTPQQTLGLALFAAAAGFDKETFYVVGSYLNTGTRANMAVVCRAGGKNDL
jgi:hypothetical protein